MDFPGWLSTCFLWSLAALCITGLMIENYRENWLQFLGMAGIILWAAGRGWDLWHRESVGFYQVLAHASLFSFALGTARKVWQNR